MSVLNCVIIEDELLARQKLELYVEQHKDLNLVASYVSAEDFLNQKSAQHELLFLDIGLPNIDGITLAGSLPKNYRIIFTTAFAEHAVEAFNINAVDYLLKPFDFDRFRGAVAKASLAIQSSVRNPPTDEIIVKEGKKIHRLPFEDILYIKGLKEYVVWHTARGQLITLHSLTDLSEYLKTFNFIQTHKSYIVNAKKVTIVEYGFIHLGELQIPIGRSYRGQVKEKFKASF